MDVGQQNVIIIVSVIGAVLGLAMCLFFGLGFCIAICVLCWRYRRAFRHRRSRSVDVPLTETLLAATPNEPVAGEEDDEKEKKKFSTLPALPRFSKKSNHVNQSVAGNSGQLRNMSVSHNYSALTKQGSSRTDGDAGVYVEIPSGSPLPYETPTTTFFKQKSEDQYYAVVPTNTLRRSLSSSKFGPVLEMEKIYELVNSCKAKDEDVLYSPPATELNGLYSQLAQGEVLELPRSALIIKEHLASGEFGNINRGSWSSPYSDMDVAIKTLKSSASDAKRLKFLQEGAIMAQFKHPNIIKLYGAVTIAEPLMLVLELMNNGDLLRWLQRAYHKCTSGSDRDSGLPSQLLTFCRDVAEGMKYLSRKEFIHRDLAARNVLLDKNLHCKIADFGLSRDLGKSDSDYYVTSGQNIPVRITAPEVLFYVKYSSKSDVWSYGMLMYEIWALGRRPFNALKTSQIVPFFEKHRGYILPPPPGSPLQLYRLMVHCWKWNHHERPSFEEILTVLSGSDDASLLAIPPDSLSSLKEPKKAGSLGSPLISSHEMYKDLHQLKQS